MLCDTRFKNICLTIPKKVVEIKKDTIIVETPIGARQEVKSIVKLSAGDFCLTQQNVAVQKISKKEAKEILNLIKK